MMSISALTGAFLATVSPLRRDDGEPNPPYAALEREVRRLRKWNARLIRSRLLMMEHIEALHDELRCARRRLDEQREANERLARELSDRRKAQSQIERLNACASQQMAQNAILQQTRMHQEAAALQQPSQAQLMAFYAQAQTANPQTWGDCTCVPGRSAALRGQLDGPG